MAKFRVLDAEVMDEPVEVDANSFRGAAESYAKTAFHEEESDVDCDLTITSSDGIVREFFVRARLEIEIEGQQ